MDLIKIIRQHVETDVTREYLVDLFERLIEVYIDKDIDAHRNDRRYEEYHNKFAGDLHVGKEVSHHRCLPQDRRLRDCHG